ncbi:MAG: TatD DNase family protein [Planctomycetota bacterium]
MITDTHSHIFWKDFDGEREAVIERARKAGVDRMLVVGTDLETSKQCFELCDGIVGLFPTAGIHPHDAEGVSDEMRAEIERMCRREECVAVGETGLDYFKEFSPRADQQRNFRWHIELANELNKPVIVHSRDAHEDTVKLLSEGKAKQGVMHCYTMGPEELTAYLELGFYISFSGVVTYPKNDANREAAALVPLDRLLVETDCPFLSPQGKRGKRNEPALIVETLKRVAEVRGANIEELAQATSANATRLFSLK